MSGPRKSTESLNLHPPPLPPPADNEQSERVSERARRTCRTLRPHLWSGIVMQAVPWPDRLLCVACTTLVNTEHPTTLTNRTVSFRTVWILHIGFKFKQVCWDAEKKNHQTWSAYATNDTLNVPSLSKVFWLLVIDHLSPRQRSLLLSLSKITTSLLIKDHYLYPCQRSLGCSSKITICLVVKDHLVPCQRSLGSLVWSIM